MTDLARPPGSRIGWSTIRAARKSRAQATIRSGLAWSTFPELGKIDPGEVDRHAAALEARQYSIHFHCWTAEEFAAQLRQIIDRFQLNAFLERRP